MEQTFTDEKTALLQFGAILNNRELSDVTFSVGNHKFYANRCVLAGRSRVFYRMLFGDLKESTSKEISINDPLVRPEVFLSFLQFLYSGTVNISPENVLHTLYLAKLYDLDSLVTKCRELANKMVSDEDALIVWDSAFALGEEEIAKTCAQYVSANTRKVLKVTKPEDVSKELLLKVVSSDSLNIPEVDLFQFVRVWSECHQESKEAISEIVSHVRFPLISMKDLVNVVKPTKLVPLEVYVEAFEFQTEPDSFDCSLRQFTPRGSVTMATSPLKLVVSLCNYTSPFDGNGILSWIFKNGGLPFPPITALPGTYLINTDSLTSSYITSDQISPILGSGNFPSTVCSSTKVPNLTLDLQKYKLIVTRCTLKCNYSPVYLNSFDFLGSNDAQTWHLLAHMDNCVGNPVTFPVKTNDMYRYFMLSRKQQTLCSGWEMYGHLYS